MTKWIKQFLLAGLAGLIRPKHNQKYSLKTKIAAVKDYQLNGLASREVLIKLRNSKKKMMAVPFILCAYLEMN